MATTFKIPRLTDREVVDALLLICKDVAEDYPFSVVLTAEAVGEVVVPDAKETIVLDSDLGFLLAQNSSISGSIYLKFQGRRVAVLVQREYTEPYDIARIEDDWRNHLDAEQQKRLPRLLLKLKSLLRKYLKAADIEVALSSDPSSAWSKYRNAQTAVLSSLQQTAESIIVDVANKNAEIDRLRAERFEKLETELRSEIAAEREKLQQENAERVSEAEKREAAHAEKEAAFETKEARYVARQKQQEQIKQLQAWLENWGLTEGTTKKRLPITIAYIVALSLTGLLTAFATWGNFELIKSAEDLAKLKWWHWLAMVSKSLFPLAAFTTFMIYFIRWSGAWARQHSEEEFRNRSRLIDIGRSGWLLEAVRDSQEKGAEIPSDLLKELSKNLFSHTPSAECEIHPAALSDIVSQGLTSLRVKSPDGSEIEASRGRRK